MSTTYKEFSDYVENTQISSDDFPHAEKGPRKLNRVSTLWVWAFTISVLYFIIKWAEPFIHSWLPAPGDIKPANLNHAINMITSGYFNFLSHYLFSGLSWLIFLMGWAVVILWALLALNIVTYTTNLVRRQRAHEREVLANDREANRMRDKLLETMHIPRLIENKQEVINKAERAEDKNENVFQEYFGTSSGKANIADENELESLKAFKDVRVNINTRQSVSGPDIDKNYLVTFHAPPSSDASDLLDKKLNGVDSILSRIVGTGVNFGGKLQSSDRTKWTFRANVAVADKYAYPETEEIAEPVVYETAFDLTLLNDNRPAIEQKKAGALKWAGDEASAIDSFLTTGDAQVTRVDIQVNASNAVYIYKQPQSFDLKKLDEYKEKFDSYFGQKGSGVTVSAGRVLITIPLPKKYNLPIDVGTMFRDVFFSPES